MTELTYLFGVWAVQIILYIIFTFGLVKRKIHPAFIFLTGVFLFLIAPQFFRVDGGMDSQTGEYICGLVAIVPVVIFCLMGNFVNLFLFAVFLGISAIRKMRN